MEPDSILVCRTTTPAWTPHSAQASGLVSGIDGALAHGAIVARELGILAVMGTGVTTQRIAAGQRTTIDGSAGAVEIGASQIMTEQRRWEGQVTPPRASPRPEPGTAPA